MSYGLQCLDAAGALNFEASSAYAGVAIDLIEQAAGGPQVQRTYPGHAGRSLSLRHLGFSGDLANVVADSPGGIPRVTLPAGPTSDRRILVCAVGPARASGYGIEAVNADGSVVLSDDSFGLHYIGKATLVGSVVQPTGQTAMGYADYQISSPHSIAPALALQSGRRMLIYDVARSGDVWTIRVMCEDDVTQQGVFFRPQFQAEIFCFARVSAPSGGWGVAIYNSDGSLAWDLTRRIIAWRQELSYSSVEQQSATAKPVDATVIKPAVLSSVGESYFGENDGADDFTAYFGWHMAGGLPRTLRMRPLGVLRESNPFGFYGPLYQPAYAALIDVDGLV